MRSLTFLAFITTISSCTLEAVVAEESTPSGFLRATSAVASEADSASSPSARVLSSSSASSSSGGHHVALDPKSIEIKTDQGFVANQPEQPVKSRRFVAYESSEWELLWMHHVDEWADKRRICNVLLNDQTHYVHDLLNILCTSHLPEPYSNWCVMDDEFRSLWYNTANRNDFELRWERPEHIPENVIIPDPQPIVPTREHEHIVSKLIFENELTGEVEVEYIEPLVSHLRFPLTHCIDPVPNDERYFYHYTTFRGWVIPPPPGTSQYFDRKLLFDAGASNWKSGSGGPSLSYFANMWHRYHMDLDEIYAFELRTEPMAFYETVPDEWKYKTHYQQCYVSSHVHEHSTEHPFLPLLFQEKAAPNDYVLFKLDIDNMGVEDGNIHYILKEENPRVHEVVWEHHIRGNYLMTEWRGPNGEEDYLPDVSLRYSYDLFLRMRRKGIRAHSWI